MLHGHAVLASIYYPTTYSHRNEGKVMFSASVDGTITLWAPNGMPYSTLEVHSYVCMCTEGSR